jgi:oligoendopeptidase F
MKFVRKNEPSGSATRILNRSEMPLADTWDLTLLYPTPEDWSKDFAYVQQQFPELLRFRGRVGESAQTLLECLESEKELNLKIERLYHYAMLRVSEDSSDPANLAREAQLQNLLTRVGEATSFINPEIQAIDDATWDVHMNDPKLHAWVVPLRKLRRLRPHTLSAAEERLLALSASALHGHGETFSQLTNVDMQFGTALDEQGREHPLTQSSFSSFLIKRDREVRRRAFFQFYDEFKAHEFTLASSLAHSVRADVFRARARNYPSSLDAALFGDAIPSSVYENLIATVRRHLQPLFRYFNLRRRVLGLDEIHHYDTYLPMVEDIESEIKFEDAIEKVLAALSPLGDEYVNALGNGLRGRWCDRYENKGKRSGAFSSSSYGNPPFILMNYKNDVFAHIYTLAHEAGHSMHTWYAQRNQEFQTYDYPIFLAEVASTFNEELLTHHLLSQTNDPKMRAYLINRQIDDIRGTVYRQTMFAEFEKSIHAIEESGDALTLDVFRRMYRKLLDEYFGKDFIIDESLELECLRIPHFYSGFYVYKYATGMSAAVSLADDVLSGVEGAAERYLGLLKSGGSKYPLETLAEAGIDMSHSAPVERTLRLFEQRVGELEQLLT